MAWREGTRDSADGGGHGQRQKGKSCGTQRL
jgi:hypothetical protein